MPTIEQSIEVEVPVSTAYNQWTQFEEFPSFMDGVDEVKQLDDTHLHWSPRSAATARSGTPRSPSRPRISALPGRPPLARAMPASSRSTHSTKVARRSCSSSTGSRKAWSRPSARWSQRAIQ
ncbi:MAG: SRPBCC family protein [Actinomycetota bacterium]